MILYLTAKKSICAAGKKELKFSSLIFSFFYLDNMSYFRYVDNGEGPTKLFIGGVHGNEGKTSLKFIKRLNIDDFSKGQFYFYNFDKTPYISTIKKEYYKSEIGLKILDLIEYFEPDFYTELHCYDLAHFDRLTSMERYTKTGIPPLIDLGNHVLVSSVSPLIRMTYFSTDTVCKTLEFPCVEKLSAEKEEKYNFNKKSAVETYEKLLNLIVRAPDREYFEKEMLKNYYNQVALAVDYAKKVFGPEFPLIRTSLQGFSDLNLNFLIYHRLLKLCPVKNRVLHIKSQ